MRAPAVALVVAVVLSVTAPGDAVNETARRASRYEHMNMDIFFNSKRLFSLYVDCLMGKKACTPEGQDLRKQMPLVLKTSCEECTPRQKEIMVKIFLRMQEDYAPQLKVLLKKWDPQGTYLRKFLTYIDTNYPEVIKNRPYRQSNPN